MLHNFVNIFPIPLRRLYVLTEDSDSSLILSFSFFHASCPLLFQPTTDFRTRTRKKLDFTCFVYVLNVCSSYPNSLNLDILFMDVYAHNTYWAYGPSLNKWESITFQLDSMAQRTAVAQCYLGTLLSGRNHRMQEEICQTRREELQSLEDLGKPFMPACLHFSSQPLLWLSRAQTSQHSGLLGL